MKNLPGQIIFQKETMNMTWSNSLRKEDSFWIYVEFKFLKSLTGDVLIKSLRA